MGGGGGEESKNWVIAVGAERIVGVERRIQEGGEKNKRKSTGGREKRRSKNKK